MNPTVKYIMGQIESVLDPCGSFSEEVRLELLDYISAIDMKNLRYEIGVSLLVKQMREESLKNGQMPVFGSKSKLIRAQPQQHKISLKDII